MNVSDVTDPVPAFDVPVSQGTIGMTVADGYLYMARGTRTFVSYRIDGSTTPDEVFLQAFVTGSAINGNRVYVVTRQRMWVLTAPDLQLAGFTTEFGAGEDIAIRVLESGGLPRAFAFVGVSAGGPGVGVVILDLFSNPAAPSQVAHVPTSAAPLDIAFRANLMYVAQGNGGLEVFDISDLGAIRRAGFFPGRDTVLRTAILENFVFGAAGTEGVFSVSVGTCLEIRN